MDGFVAMRRMMTLEIALMIIGVGSSYMIVNTDVSSQGLGWWHMVLITSIVLWVLLVIVVLCFHPFHIEPEQITMHTADVIEKYAMISWGLMLYICYRANYLVHEIIGSEPSSWLWGTFIPVLLFFIYLSSYHWRYDTS